jgi:biopolymer transport protein ExbD
MASSKLRNAASVGDQDNPVMDMSPMIDMVFLLLIFFMVASTLITIKQDPNIKPPVALGTKPGDFFKGRVVVNIYSDGKIYGVDGQDGPQLDDADITRICAETKEAYKGENVKAKLHIRANADAPVLAIKKATKAAAAGGVIDVIFSAYGSK